MSISGFVCGTSSIDWIAFTLHHDTPIEALFARLGGDFESFDWGGNCYRRHARNSSGIRVYWDNVDGLGHVNVQIPGCGCRFLEAAGIVAEWSEWIGSWLSEGATFSRIDLAVDDRLGMLDMDRIREALESGCFATRARREKIAATFGVGGRFPIQLITLGGRSSETYGRIYNKAHEQRESGHWIRFEVEFKGRKARRVAELVSDGDLEAVYGLLRGVIDFKDAKHDTSDVTRRRSADWWASFLARAPKVLAKVTTWVNESVQKARHHLSKQFGPTIWAITESEGGGIDWLIETIKLGAHRARARHRLMAAGGVA